MIVAAEEHTTNVKDRARRSRLLRRFVLPPVEERRMIGFIKASYFRRLRKDNDDTYIYYLLIEWSLLVTALFALCLLASGIFHMSFPFYFFTIYTNPDDLARSVGWTYSRVVSTTLLLIFLPYAWLLFRANIDFNTRDLLHWQDRSTEQQRRGNVLWQMLVDSSVCLMVAYCSWSVPDYFIGKHPSLQTSYTFFLVTLACLTWLYSAIPVMVVMGCAISYQHLRRLGPRYNSCSLRNELSSAGRDQQGSASDSD
jgi:hypothetical protein